MIVGEFSRHVEYFCNPCNRSLFDNWNGCIEHCATSWLSILHDDDLLLPNFIETMPGLAKAAPERALYFGRAMRLENGNAHLPPAASWEKNWRELDIIELVEECF